MTKSFKRELGAAAFVLWAIVVVHLLIFAPVDEVAARLPILSAITLPIWSYLGVVFTAHSFKDGINNKLGLQEPRYDDP